MDKKRKEQIRHKIYEVKEAIRDLDRCRYFVTLAYDNSNQGHGISKDLMAEILKIALDRYEADLTKNEQIKLF